MFAKHRVAANLLMVVMIISGAIGVDRLRTQFFPSFELDVITVSVAWPGATAEDVQEGLAIPIENAIKETIRSGLRTGDVAQGTDSVGTGEMGQAIIDRLA